jgi:hypothetical protein
MTIRVGGGFLSMLTIVFVGLKLARIIDWPWLWVLSPLWIPAALTLCGVLLALLIALVAMIFFRGAFKKFSQNPPMYKATPEGFRVEKNVTPEKK